MHAVTARTSVESGSGGTYGVVLVTLTSADTLGAPGPVAGASPAAPTKRTTPQHATIARDFMTSSLRLSDPPSRSVVTVFAARRRCTLDTTHRGISVCATRQRSTQFAGGSSQAHGGIAR